MPFGNKTITFVFRSDTGTRGIMGTYAQGETPMEAPGCRHRPLTFTEIVDAQFDIAIEPWKSTIPIGEYPADLLTGILSLKPGDAIQVDGQQYEVIAGIRPHDDFIAPFKATLISKRWIG